MRGFMPEEGTNPVQFPDVGGLVWSWFLTLNASRQQGMSGSLAISNTEMLAFFQLEGVWPEQWELRAIRLLDGVAMESFCDSPN